jgi:hypothetical protein
MGGEVILRYRGRQITELQLEFIRRLIEEHPSVSRRRLSAMVCEAWDWRQANGQLSDMICRGLLLALERGGFLQLPPKKFSPHNPLGAERRRPPCVEVDRSPLGCSLKELGPLEFRQVRASRWEPMWAGLIEEHHYLGYCHPVGEQLKYLVFAKERPVAAFGFSSAARHLGPRDRYIGWTPQGRKAHIHLIGYNTRFLVLPWVRVPYLASHLLAGVAKRIAGDWQQLYGHPVHFLESFVDTELFSGTSYRAAGWVYLGLTTGRGKNDHTYKPNRSLKAVWGQPLRRDFRRQLGVEEA